MTILKHEIRQGRNSLIIWTAVIAFMLGVCILIYPEMSKQMDGISGRSQIWAVFLRRSEWTS